MSDIEEALSQIADIKAQLMASTRFRGFAPGTLVAVAIVCALATVAQLLWPSKFAGSTMEYVEFWAIVLSGTALFLAVEAFSRSRILHGAMSGAMLVATLRQLLPFAAAQLVISIVICRNAPESAWLLPGLWQIIVALVGFCALTNLPRTIMWAAAWFFLCGTFVLLMAGTQQGLSPWMMGVPFTIGYALIALILYRSQSEGHARA